MFRISKNLVFHCYKLIVKEFFLWVIRTVKPKCASPKDILQFYIKSNFGLIFAYRKRVSEIYTCLKWALKYRQNKGFKDHTIFKEGW